MANSKISALTSATTPLAGTETVPVVQSSTTKQVSVANLTAGRAVSALSYTSTTGANFATSSGSVGINTSSPYTKLEVVGGAISVGTGGTASNLGIEILPTQTSIPAAQVRGYVATGDSTIGVAGDLLIAPRTSVAANIRFITGTSPTERLKIAGAGDITVSTGNVVQGTAAKGFNFTANTPAAGMTSQLLNWYEEGTFTPVVSGTTTAGAGTYTAQAGQYTRIGNRLFFVINLGWTAHTGTGNMFISGFPFTSANIANTASPMSVRVQNLALTAGNVPQFYMSPNQNYFILAQVPVGGGAEAAVPIDTNASIFLSGQYQI
jgi:hypothetical protein